MSSNIEVKTRMIEEKYIELPFNYEAYGEHHSGTVEIKINDLVECVEWAELNHRYDSSAFIGLGNLAERALENAGFATIATRGGVWAENALVYFLEEIGVM